MAEKLTVGPFNRGIRTDREPFNIDNDSFPTLINAYQWRGRIKRKRGTALLGRLQRFFNSLSSSYSSFSDGLFDGSGNGNLLKGPNSFLLETNSTLVPGTISLTDASTSEVFTDPNKDGILHGSGGINTGTVNYSSGAIVIATSAGHQFTASFVYNPSLPVMGLEELTFNQNSLSGTLAFDTTYSYGINSLSPYIINDVSFYKNPPSGTFPGYVQKTNWTPTTWNGQSYQQFWTVNYEGALWATNGINVPFNTTNIGMQYNTITAVTIVNGVPPAVITITTGTNHGLVIGDFVFINEIIGMTGINFQSGYVTAVPAVNQITVTFPNATIAGVWASGGIVQYLTNRSSTSVDCLRWYDGDPTNGSATNPIFAPGNGWVNFAPPLSQGIYSIAGLPQKQYYLVGARIIYPFQDRLLFIGPIVQTSASGSQVYLQDTVIFSQNGVPYYTASYTNTPNPAIDTPTSVNTIFNPILTPNNQTATSPSWFTDQVGFGGFISAGLSDQIISLGSNENSLILGFQRRQTRLIATGDGTNPFEFFRVNSEYGTTSTFSAITMDSGVLSRGDRGYITTSQTNSQRIDLDIPDQVFEINLTNNGSERFTAQRDFINEWVYFTYLSNESRYSYPNQTLQYNYRDQSYAIFNETYTTYGLFRRGSGLTWATLPFKNWKEWTSPWNFSTTTLDRPEVIAGNQQGFVIFRDDGTDEDTSLYIQSFSGSTVTAPDHCLNEGDYIYITGCLGTIGPLVNDQIFSVSTPTQSTFVLNPIIGTGTYFGSGYITRLYVPFIQTKQFPMAWAGGKKSRIGSQQYLFSTTQSGQCTVQIYLSQNSAQPYNTGTIFPAPGSINNSLIYSQTIYTCPEGTNLNLTPFNVNLNLVTAPNQAQIWHRMNTSLIGDTIQLGFTLSDAQMRDVNFGSQVSEFELHGFIIDVSPSGYLA